MLQECCLRSPAHINDLPASSLFVLQFFFYPCHNCDVSALLNAILVAHHDFTCLRIPESDNFLRSEGDDKDVDVVFQDLNSLDLRGDSNVSDFTSSNMGRK